MTPELRTYFAPKRGLTETVVHRLVNSLDGRRNIDQKAATGVVCGILSMRGVPKFAVNRMNLTKEECKAFDAVVDMHFGELLQRQTGRNVYSVRDSFKQPMQEPYRALEQAEGHQNGTPVVFAKADYQPQIVIMYAADWFRMLSSN